MTRLLSTLVTALALTGCMLKRHIPEKKDLPTMGIQPEFIYSVRLDPRPQRKDPFYYSPNDEGIVYDVGSQSTEK